MTTVALALAAGLAAGCGADDEGQPLPEGSATELLGQLQSIQDRFEAGAGACTDITEGDDTNTAVVQSTLESLPDGVDADVRDAVRQGFERLFELVQQECDAAEEPPETDTTETEPIPPPTDTTETTETTETEPTTPTTDTAPTAPPDTGEEPPPEVPPGQGGENPGQGNGGGAVGPEEGGG